MIRSIRIVQAGRSSYETKVRLIAGLLAGFVASLGIMGVVTAMLILTGNDIWMAVRLIASAVYGENAGLGWVPIAVGTILHLTTGTFFGAAFALLVPRLPPNIYVVVGLIYGIVTGVVMTLLVVPVAAPLMIASSVNVAMLIFAHLVYGFILGIAAGIIEILWALPKTAKSD